MDQPGFGADYRFTGNFHWPESVQLYSRYGGLCLGRFWCGLWTGAALLAVTVLVWKQIDWLGLYEIVPGFLLSLIAVFVVSKMDREPSASVVNTFDAVGKSEI